MSHPDWSETHRRLTDTTRGLGVPPEARSPHAALDKPPPTAYYRPDAQGLNPGDPATRTLDPRDGKEYTYATTRNDIARAIAERHTDLSIYRVTLDQPIEADPDAAEDNLGELFVRSPSGAVVDAVDENEK